MTIDKLQLRRLAEKATKGPWWVDSHGHRMTANGGLDTVFVADDRMGKAVRHPETGNLSHWPNDWDATYIANANPKTILGLLDEIESLQEECEKLRKDAERIEWLEEQTKKSRTGISFNYHRHVEDGCVVEHGYRFMRRHFVSGFKDSLRKAIDDAASEFDLELVGD